MNGLRIKQHYGRVLLIADGKVVADMPWQAADQVSAALKSVARLAEEWDKAEQIAKDGAVLLRAGVPIGLTDHPRIKAEVAKIAVNDRSLRRYMPGGVKSREVFGTPGIIQFPPRAKQ